MLVSCLVLGLALLSTGFAQPIRRGPKKVATAWYAGWDANDGFAVSDISWSKYTELTYAFAIPTSDVNTLSLDSSDPSVLVQFVAAAHQNGVKAKISVGGWSGSKFWSTSVKTAANRAAFVKTLISFVKQYKLDGLDFDWEYPGTTGAGDNAVSPDDTSNFLLFLQALRKDPLGSTLILSAAVSITPFAGPDGKPLSDVSGFSKVLDYIAIMNYDIWGSWSPSVGPNAPLADACAASKDRAGSATSAIAAWTAAGIPASQIVLGVAAYGHSFRVKTADAFVEGTKTLATYMPFESGSSEDFDFGAVIEAGLLNNDGSPKADVPYLFDKCSQTAYVYNSKTQVMISFDDAPAFAAKGEFIQSHGLLGFAIWEAGGDFNDILLDSILDISGC